MSSDPRNDRLTDDDRCDDRPRCETCNVLFDDAKDAAFTDGHLLWCAECVRETEKEGVVEAAITGEAPAPMGTVEAMAWAVERALGGNRLLDGGPSYGEDDEPETVETPTLSDAELRELPMAGRKAEAA